MKNLIGIIFFIINLCSFSFSIDSLEFDKKIGKGEIGEKEFTITNDSDFSKKYEISVKESNNKSILKNIKISPSLIILKKNDSKKVKIQIKNNGLKNGEYDYYLVVQERNIKSKKVEKNMAFLNKNINILQYFYVGDLNPDLKLDNKEKKIKNFGERRGKFILEIHFDKEQPMYSKVEFLKINESKNVEDILKNSKIPRKKWDEIKKIVVLNI